MLQWYKQYCDFYTQLSQRPKIRNSCRYAQVVNMRFTKIVGFQFMASMMVICCNLYQLTKSALSINHVPLIMYTTCMLTQIFIYCWFGNKVKSKVYIAKQIVRDHK